MSSFTVMTALVIGTLSISIQNRQRCTQIMEECSAQILIGLSACCLLPDIFIPFFSILSCLICVYYSEFKKNTIFLKHF